MATTKLVIRKNKINAAGECVVYVLYTHDGNTTQFSTEKKIDPNFWNPKRGEARDVEGFKGAKKFNSAIKAKKAIVDDIVSEAQYRNIDPSLAYVRQQYELLSKPDLPEANKDFFSLYEQYIEDNRTKKAYNTLKQHRNALNHLKEYQAFSKRKITLDNITLDFHAKFTSYLISVKNHSPNSIGDVIKNLKIFLGKLTEDGINTNQAFRHKSFSKPSAPVDLIALTQSELDQLYTADLSGHSRLARVRDLFVFGCVTGLRFSDIENLKPENFRPDSIDFITLKTKDRLSVPLVPYARAILARYEGRLPEVMSNQKMNDYLKELCQLCGIDEPVQRVRYLGSTRIESKAPKWEMVSTHTARRTFITLALERGTRPEIVMRITGHKDIKTMMKYVRLTDKAAHSEFLRPYGEGGTKLVM
jgi:integrase